MEIIDVKLYTVYKALTIVLEESSIYVSCLHKQTPFSRSVSAATTSVSIVVTLDPIDIGLYQGLYSS